ARGAISSPGPGASREPTGLPGRGAGMRCLVLLLAGVLALAGCGADSPSDGPDVTGEWQLTSGAFIGADLPFPPGATATLALSDGQASGTAFCNRFFASYELDGSSFSFGDIGSTMMG